MVQPAFDTPALAAVVDVDAAVTTVESSVLAMVVAVGLADVSVTPVAEHTRSPPSLPSYAPLVPHDNTNPLAAPVVLYPALHTGVQLSPELRGAHDE